MLASAVVVSTRLRKTLFKPYVKCTFTELIRKAVLPDNAESTSPVANFIETHKRVNWSLMDVYHLRKGVFSFYACTVVTQQAYSNSCCAFLVFVIGIWRVTVQVMYRNTCWSACSDPFSYMVLCMYCSDPAGI